MSSYNRNILISGIRILMLRNETACANDVEGCYAEETLGVVDAFGLEDLGADGYSAVDRICDD